MLTALTLIFVSTLGAVLLDSPNAGAVSTSTPPVLIYGNIMPIQQSYPDLKVTDDGRTYVVWTQRSGANDNVMFSYSTNNGTSFSPPKVLNTNISGNQARPRIDVTDAGIILVTWIDSSNDGGDVYLTRSVDGGETFEPEYLVHPDTTGTQFNPDITAKGDTVAIVWEEEVHDNSIRIWNANNGVLDRTLDGHTAATLCLEFSPDGSTLASGGEDSLVRIWNPNTGALVQNLTDHANYVTSLNWSYDGSMLASGSYDQNVTIWNVPGYTVMNRLNQVNGVPTQNSVNALAFSPNSSQIAVGYLGKLNPMQPQGPPSDMFNLTVWNLSDYSNWTVNEDTVGHNNEIKDVSFSHNGTLLASCSKDRTLKVWNVTTGALLRDINLNTEAYSLSWSANDTLISTALANGTVAVVNITTSAVQYWLKSHTSRVNTVSWSEVRDEIASGASELNAKVWELAGKTARLNLSGHQNSVYTVDWSSDGNHVATGGGNSGQYGMGEKQVFCLYSTDAGLTFTNPAAVSDNNLALKSQPRVDMDAAYNVHVVWYISGSGVGIFYSNSSDGVTFNEDVGISAGSEWVTPDVAVEDSGAAHVVWQQKNGVTNIHYANSTDGFSNDVQLTTDGQLPRVAVSDSGSVLWAGWRPTAGSTYPFHANVSVDHGQTFGDPTTLTTERISASAISVDSYGQTSFVWINWNRTEIYHSSTVLQDNWRPTVIGNFPAHNAVDVSVFTNILVNFSEPMDQASVEGGFSVNNATHSLDQNDCSSITWNGYGDKVNFSFETPLDYNGFYSVTIASSATDLSGNSLASNYVFTFTTSADVDPPVIEHIQPALIWGYDQPYDVEVTIIDWWGTVTAADLHYKGVSDSNFIKQALTNIGGGLYTASIPAQGSLGNVSYYFTASDNENNNGRLPLAANQYFNYTVVDSVGPVITHIPEDIGPVQEPIGISAVVVDQVQLVSVSLYYLGVGESNFTHVNMTTDTSFDPNGYSCTIPAQMEIGNLRYNITATDGSNNSANTSLYTVAIVDQLRPDINSVIPEYLANETEVLVRANITDNVAVDEVTLYFKAVGGDHWVERNMANVGGDIFEFTIPAQRRSGTIFYYVNATDTSGNLASTLTEQDQFQVEVIGTGPNNTLYYALAIVLIALVVVLVYLMVTKFGGKAGKSEQKPDTPEESESGPKGEEPKEQERVDEDEGQ
ncbi:MAG: hypothetical protein AYK23_01210 [Candidatus Proteinoplasmatales archaeon SG8-5]|nr:MAG: hypothetical protein AYK23_01210 [Candidatus Proteinoplasmatales archaeon SG8-5]